MLPIWLQLDPASLMTGLASVFAVLAMVVAPVASR